MTEQDKLKAILKNELIDVYFQKLYSHHESFSTCIETFVKGIDPETGEPINAKELFETAESLDMSIELDILAMSKALEAFKPIYLNSPGTILFMNVSEHIIEYSDPMQLLYSVVESSGIKPSSISLDISFYDNVDFKDVVAFIEQYRALGFYISIDDIGKNYFNIDRVLLLNPDIIKINLQHMNKLANPMYTKRVHNFIASIAHKMGMIVIETGIETEEELIYANKQDAQYFQGYFVHKPEKVAPLNVSDFLNNNEAIDIIKSYQKESTIEDIRPFMNKMVMFLSDIREDSHFWQFNKLDQHIDQLFQAHPSIENGWILDKKGIQISKAMINSDGFSHRNARIFKIYDRGHDYSDYDFFSLLSSGALDVWITKPFLSLLSNQVCVTTSSYIEPEGQEPLILCMVFNYNMFNATYVHKLKKPDE